MDFMGTDVGVHRLACMAKSMINFCTECGDRLVPLFVHLVCPNECDKKLPRAANLKCFCGSTDVADFSGTDEGDVHCWACGRVWFK